MSQLTITAAEWASVQDGTLWLVREGGWPKACPLADPTDCNGEHCDCPLSPPVEFVQACAPCETCGESRQLWYVGTPTPCPDCRIELVGPCPSCDGSGTYWNDTGVVGYPMEPLGCPDCEATGTVTLGHAYAVGQPLLIVESRSHRGNRQMGDHVCVSGRLILAVVGDVETPLTDLLAHAGPPETLVGKWAMRIELKVVGS